MASSIPFDGTNFLTTVPDDTEPHGNDYQEHQATKKSMEFVNNKEHTDIANDPSVANGGGEHSNGSSVAYFASSAPTLRPDGVTALADNDIDKGRTWKDANSGDSLKTWNGSSWIFSGLPTGTCIPYIATNAPAGWIRATGQSIGLSGGDADLNSDSYTVLRALLVADSNPYGVDGNGNPKVADMRGRAAVGRGTASTTGSNIAWSLGETNGQDNVLLTENEIPEHNHTFSGFSNASTTGSEPNFGSNTGTPRNENTDDYGADGEHLNIQPSMGLTYIIKL